MRKAIFRRFERRVPVEAFDYVYDESGFLIEYRSDKPWLAYQDVGVQGAGTKLNRAPNSPFRFRDKKPPDIVFEYWILKKKIAPRDAKGNFISRKKFRFALQNKIYETGLVPKNYFYNLDVEIEKVTKAVIEADMEFIGKRMDLIIEKYK